MSKVKLTIPGTDTVISGTLESEGTGAYAVRIDGIVGIDAYIFHKSDGWKIERLLPTKKGALVRNENGVLFVRRGGEYPWVSLPSLNVFTDEHMNSSGNVLPKIQVIFEGVDD